MSPAEAVMRAAAMCLKQGASPSYVFVNSRDFAGLEEHRWAWGVEAEIDRVATTYQERTTMHSQMHAMWRLSRRRGRQFDARVWWQGRKNGGRR